MKENKTPSKKGYMPPTLSMAERHPQNIPDEVWEGWKAALRINDAGLIAAKLKRSRPLIDRAIKYGHVKDASLVIKITKFFADRKQRELNALSELTD